MGINFDIFNLGGLHEKHAVVTWNIENHHSICLTPVSGWTVVGPSGCIT